MISTITPVYNNAEYLEPCIESLLSQHWSAFYGEVEHIFLDDNSTDNSLEILRKYEKDPRVRVIQNDLHLGMAKRRYFGIKIHALGEIIMLHDADEIIPPSYIYQMNLLLQQYRVVHPSVIYQYGLDFKIRRYQQDGNNWQLPARMFYKKDWLDKGGFDTELGVYELGSFSQYFKNIGIARTYVIDLGKYTLKQIYERSYQFYLYKQRYTRYYNFSMRDYHIKSLLLPLGLITLSPIKFVKTLGAIKGYIQRK